MRHTDGVSTGTNFRLTKIAFDFYYNTVRLWLALCIVLCFSVVFLGELMQFLDSIC